MAATANASAEAGVANESTNINGGAKVAMSSSEMQAKYE